jgi:hypothetical protein
MDYIPEREQVAPMVSNENELTDLFGSIEQAKPRVLKLLERVDQ